MSRSEFAPPPAERSHCRSCGAEIRWALNPASGKRIPFNALPDPLRGTHYIAYNSRLDPTCIFSPPSDREPRVLYLSHFATCPNASQHRASPRPRQSTESAR